MISLLRTHVESLPGLREMESSMGIDTAIVSGMAVLSICCNESGEGCMDESAGSCPAAVNDKK
jgi:hypothetical protein